MKLNKTRLLFFLLFAFPILAFSQPINGYSTQNKKAIKLYEGALVFIREKMIDDAKDYLLRAIEKDTTFINAYMVMGDLYSDLKSIDTALLYYNKAIDINPNFYPKLMYMTAKRELEIGRYANALQHFTWYYEHPKFDISLKKEVDKGIEICEFSLNLIANPVAFDLRNLGKNINEASDEYVNSLSTDENFIIFTKRRQADENSTSKYKKLEEDFYSSKRDSTGNWMLSEMMSTKFNSHGNEGAMTFSPDGKMIVFAADQRDDCFGSFDLYMSFLRGNNWTIPKNMGIGVNTEFWDSQPSISSDGKLVLFVSKRPGGYGGSDIYYVTKNSEGIWGNPVNMGNVINTTKNEMTPFLHQDGKTLYFASQGHLGMGGFDVFYSRLDEKGNWSTPINIGYPINSYGNEIGMIINARGEIAYISSDKYEGMGGFDIFSFPLYEAARPVLVNYMRGIVLDADSKIPLEAKFELSNLMTSTSILNSTSDPNNGSYFVCIPTNVNLGLNVQKDGYLFYSENFSVEGDHSKDKPFEKIIYLKKIKIGETIVLKNIFFETASYQLKDESKVELEKLYNLLAGNPNLKIEIGGHTDNVGKKEDNQKLSEQRAKIVMEYLTSKGIAANRLSYKGYGEDQPINSNDNEEGRKNNRRTEMKVTGN